MGDRIIDQMNDKNQEVANWGLNHVDITSNDIILDIGCGGGTNIYNMAKKAQNGKVYGLDYSPKAVKRSKELNKSLIKQNRAEILEGSVSKMSFENETFDIITAIKTVFFWPDLINDFREVKRVLKDNGKFIIIADYTGNGGKMMKFAEKLMEMDAKNDSDTVKILNQAGFNTTTYLRKVSEKKEIVKINNNFKKEIPDTFRGKSSPSDKMSEWMCIIAEKK